MAVRPLRLLLVEDHLSSLQTLTLFLRRDGHHVAPAPSAAEARAAAEKEKFDLVISDLGLPDASGTELMEMLRDAHGLRELRSAVTGWTTTLSVRARPVSSSIWSSPFRSPRCEVRWPKWHPRKRCCWVSVRRRADSHHHEWIREHFRADATIVLSDRRSAG